MGCNSCKDKNKIDGLSVYKNDRLSKERESKTLAFSIFEYTMRSIMFLILMAISPLIIFFVWYLLFKTIILNNGSVNLKPFLLDVGKKLNVGRTKINYEEDDDYEDLDVNRPDDYVLDEPVDEIRI